MVFIWVVITAWQQTTAGLLADVFSPLPVQVELIDAAPVTATDTTGMELEERGWKGRLENRIALV